MTIYDEIAAEREYQDRKWGGPEADDANNAWHDWVTYIVQYATGWRSRNPTSAGFRRSMVMVAALAVAAIEQTDRLYPDKPEPESD